jgi:hypothetical protein
MVLDAFKRRDGFVNATQGENIVYQERSANGRRTNALKGASPATTVSPARCGRRRHNAVYGIAHVAALREALVAMRLGYASTLSRRRGAD